MLLCACSEDSADRLIESKNGALCLALAASKSVSLIPTASKTEVVPNATPTQLLAQGKAVLYKLESVFVVILGQNKVLPTMQLPLPVVSTSVSKASHSVARASASASQSVPKFVPVASQPVLIAYNSIPISGPLAYPSHLATQSVSVASQSVPVASNSMPLSVPVASSPSHSVLQPASAANISRLAVKQAMSMTTTKRKELKLGSSTEFQCDECGLSYMSSKTLNRHKKEKHSCTTSSGSQSCLENECSFSSFHVHQLREHLEKSHSIDMKICTKKFESNHGLFHFVHCVLFVIDFRF